MQRTRFTKISDVTTNPEVRSSVMRSLRQATHREEVKLDNIVLRSRHRCPHSTNDSSLLMSK
ncbi:MAG: hypothetical protein AB1589_00555 [Cyanobacteriota bacterium]